MNYFNAKSFEAVLENECENLKIYLCNKWREAHKGCKKCENNCHSLSKFQYYFNIIKKKINYFIKSKFFWMEIKNLGD